MEEQLISFETAKLAKQKGFDIPVRYGVFGPKMKLTENHGWERHKKLELNNWNKKPRRSYSVPTQSLLQRWLRKIHKIDVLVMRIPPEAISAHEKNGKNILKNYNCYIWDLNGNPRIPNNGFYDDVYEIAFEQGLLEALKLIK